MASQAPAHNRQETGKEVAGRLRAQLARGNKFKLRRLLLSLHFADLADVLAHYLEPEEAQTCFEQLTVTQAGLVLTCLDEELQRVVLAPLSPVRISKILKTLSADDVVDILQSLSTEERYRVMGEMPLDRSARDVHQLLIAQPDTAEAMMTTDFIAVPDTATVGDALARIRSAEEKYFIYYVFLTAEDERLAGVVSLKRLMLHTPETPLVDVAARDVKSVLLNFDQELVANLFRKYYNLLAMPVVDAEDHLRGVITLDDVLDVIDEETSADFYRSSGINLAEPEDERHLLSGPALAAVRARLPWLSITLVGQFISAAIIASFQQTVAQAVITFSFLPLLSGLSGNMGTQSDTIAVRGLALGQLRDDNIREKWLRELRVAGITALILGSITATFSWVQYRHWPLSLLLFISVLGLMCVSASMGILIPWALQRYWKFDPAGIGGPFLTTVMDLMTFISYLSVMSLMVHVMI